MDRFIVNILMLLIVLLAAGILLATLGIVDPAIYLPSGVAGHLADELMRFNQTSFGRMIAGSVSLLVGTIGSLVFLRRIVPTSSNPRESHILSADERGVVIVEKQGIAAVAEAAASRVRGVVQTHVRVIGAGDAPVRLVARCRVHAGADLKRAGEEVRQRTSQAVEELVSLQVNDVLVRLEVLPLEELSRMVE